MKKNEDLKKLEEEVELYESILEEKEEDYNSQFVIHPFRRSAYINEISDAEMDLEYAREKLELLKYKQSLTPEKIKKMELEKEEKIKNEKIKEKIFYKCNELLNFKFKFFYNKNNYENKFKYLTGFAIDVLTIMIKEQNFKESPISLFISGKLDITNISIDLLKWVDCSNSIKNEIYINYGVDNIDELLVKYEKIRNFYYRVYQNLTSEEKEKYQINKLNSPSQKYSCLYDSSLYFNDCKYFDWFREIQKDDFMLKVILEENLEFLPSKQELINMLNKRVLKSDSYEFLLPSDIYCTNFLSEEEFMRIMKESKNLTKYMSIEEVVKFYNKAIIFLRKKLTDEYYSQILSEQSVEIYCANVQKIFCDIILEKKNIKCKNKTKYEEELVKIAKNELKDSLKFLTTKTNSIIEKKESSKQNIIEGLIELRNKLVNNDNQKKAR